VHKKILELEGVGLSFDDRTLAMDSLLVEVGTDFKESYSQFKRLLSGKVMSGISMHNPAIASTQMTLDIARSHSTYTVADPIRDFKIDELNFDFGNNLDPSLFVKTLLTVAEEKRGRMEQAVGPAEGHREDPQRAIPGGGLGMGRDTVAIDGTELVDLNLALWNSVLEHAPHEDEGTSVLIGCLERACKHLEIRYNLSDIEETKRLLLD